MLDFWDDFSTDGKLDPRDDDISDKPTGSLATRFPLAAGDTKEVTFYLTWRFPNRYSWSDDTAKIGNYYATKYEDAWDAANKLIPQIPQLEARSKQFVHSFLSADMPVVVKEAALNNVSTLRTQTCFRTADGRFYGWEGSLDSSGSCHGSCTHVWNYEQTTAFLFGDLAENMRSTEFEYATRSNGFMSFRVDLPIERGKNMGGAAADGQMGTLMKLYREWQLSGDDAFLRRLWPNARKALEFCWIPGGWDADKDGIMEGCQHNTMDVEYYGPNPQMEFWYLGALRAAEEMARYLGEADFAATCHSLFEKGSKWTDENLFNGEYYEHQIWPAKSREDVAEGLMLGMGGDPTKPILQLGAGCLVDQLVGQYLAHICGLGYLGNRDHISTTLKSLMKYNYKPLMWGHFNPMRSYALQDESAMLMASYPRGNRPNRPFPYVYEVMTGFEYTAGIHMLYEGLIDDGMRVIGSIRARYDGKRRSPFNEAECGHHYSRAMTAWGSVLALTGFHYSGVTKTITFACSDEPTQVFWSTGRAWGISRQRSVNPMDTSSGSVVEIVVEAGQLALESIALTGIGTQCLDSARLLLAGDSVSVTVTQKPA